ncbi:MAG: hypothetical protein KC502_17850, partial [Myxococcales bacterium]|nr:hypothetical protein [Myxococcales bacterium]
MRVRFSEVKKGYSFEILRRCNSAPHNFAFETVVFPGTYKVSASGYTAGYSNLPTTPQVIYDSLTLTKPTSGVTLNVTTVPVSGVVTLNGKTPQFGQYCDKNSSSRYMRVRFSEVKKGYSFEVLRRCNSAPHNFAFETVVFPGTYRVSASGYTAGYSNLPTTPQVIYENLTLTKPTSGVTLNVTTVPVSGVVTLNGKTPQFGQYCDKNSSSRYMRVRFSEVKKGYSFEILRRCNSTPHNFSFETVVFPGTYKVTASGYTAGYSNLPTTPQIIYDNLTLTKPTSGVTLNVTTVSVAGVVTLNGKVPQFGQYCDKNSSSRYMRVRFSEVKKGYSFEILRRCNSAPHDFSFSTVVYPGVYQIRVSGYTSGYSNLPTTMQTIVDKLEIK